MLIGKKGAATTEISSANAGGVTIRGRDLANDLLGRLTFTDAYFLMATGQTPTAGQSAMLDACLIAIAEHGLTPSVQAARMTYAADPAALQGAVAAGVLGCGTVILGAADLCRRLLQEVLDKATPDGDVQAAAIAVAQLYREAKRTVPGFGHPLHKPVDPRAERLIALAHEKGLTGRYIAAASALTPAVAKTWGKPLPMNISMAIAATALDAGIPASIVRGIPILARTAGLLAHLGEEAENPIGFYLASKAEEAIRHTQSEKDAGAP